MPLGGDQQLPGGIWARWRPHGRHDRRLRHQLRRRRAQALPQVQYRHRPLLQDHPHVDIQGTTRSSIFCPILWPVHGACTWVTFHTIFRLIQFSSISEAVWSFISSIHYPYHVFYLEEHMSMLSVFASKVLKVLWGWPHFWSIKMFPEEEETPAVHKILSNTHCKHHQKHIHRCA